MRKHTSLLLVFMVPVLISAQQLPSDRLFIYSMQGAVTCMNANGHPVMLARYHEIPDSVTVDIGPGGVIRVYAEANLFGEFFGPKVLTFADLRNGVRRITGERDKKASDIWNSIMKKITDCIHSFSSDVVDTMTPAAVRGDLEGMNEARLIPITPRNGIVTGDSLQFVWHSGSPERTSTFRIVDEDAELVFSADLHGESVTLNPKRVGLIPGGTYIWSVSGPAGAPGEAPFRLADARVVAATREGLRIADSFSAGDEIAGHVARAAVYEQNDCYGNAFLELHAAARVDTSVAARVMFMTFVIDRLGMSRHDIEEAFPDLVVAPASKSAEATDPH